MPSTTALEIEPGLIQLTTMTTGVRFWLAIRRDGEFRYSYCEKDARAWLDGVIDPACR